jgi:protein-tyrosine-phosphatase
LIVRTRQAAELIESIKMNRILFLCTGNYYRSRFAEELFNHQAGRRGLNWWASSRALALEKGIDNLGPISPFTMRALSDRNIMPGDSRFPAACRIEDLEIADLIVAVDEAEHRALLEDRFPGWQDSVTYWHVSDIDFVQPGEATAQIESMVRDLISKLPENGPVACMANSRR